MRSCETNYLHSDVRVFADAPTDRLNHPGRFGHHHPLPNSRNRPAVWPEEQLGNGPGRWRRFREIDDVYIEHSRDCMGMRRPDRGRPSDERFRVGLEASTLGTLRISGRDEHDSDRGL